MPRKTDKDRVTEQDFIDSVAAGLQFISAYHPADYVRHLTEAWRREESPAAKEAMAQILVNSRLAATGHRPMCQDTGLVNAFVRVGLQAAPAFTRPIEVLVDEAVARAYRDDANPLRASVVVDPLFGRRNSGDNTPASVTTSVVPGDRITVSLMAKGGGSENKARFTVLNPAGDVVDWVLRTVESLGAGWCPPGILSLGVGGSVDMAMRMAKEALFEPIDMGDLIRRGPSSPEDGLRIRLYEAVNALGIGAQGLGGMTTVVDVKLRTHGTHAASKPVALIPQCAADRHITFTLDGSGPATFTPPRAEDWPEVALDRAGSVKRVNLDTLTKAEIAGWQPGERLLLSGSLLTGRDAAHKRIADMLARGEALPVDFRGRTIYYVGPVDPVGTEVVGPAGPTTATRMDPFTGMMLEKTGLIAMIGKAERGPEAAAEIARHGAAYLIAVGGAAILVAQAIRKARVVAFADLGMEAVHEFEVEEMPVTVAVDASGRSIHHDGPAEWRRRIAERAPAG